MKKAHSRTVAGVCATLLAATVSAGAAATAPEQVKIVENQITEPLTDKPGDPKAGAKWFADRKLGNCLACHANKDMSELPFHGEIGPAMDGVGDRYKAAELRALLVNAKAVMGEQTIMPAFYKKETGERVLEKFEGKTILSGQQVEDIIAYLLTLKE